MATMKIKKGDTVQVLTGKDKGATGRPVPLLTTWLLSQESSTA